MAADLTTCPDIASGSVTPRSPVPDGLDAGPRPDPAALRAGVQVTAAVVLIIALATLWLPTAGSSKPAALALLFAFLALLAVVTLAATARRRTLVGVTDWLLVAAGVTVTFVAKRGALLDPRYAYPSDEGRLVAHAIAAIASGQDPYARTYPDVAHFAGNTPLFGGGGWQIFGYPPLSVEVGAALHHVWAPLGTPAIVGGLGLLATLVICMRVLPETWRPLAVVLTLGGGPLSTYAANGHPALLALPLLCLACRRWTRIGTSGRLGRSGWVQAACLGLAAGAQQLAWFPALGLLLGVWLVRRAELTDRGALTVVARFAAAAAGVFVLVNVPFVIAGPRTWSTGVLAQFVGPHPVASGQGLVALSVVMRGGSGAFAFYSYATALLLLALLAVIAVNFHRVAAAVPVVLTLVFLASVRSPAEYFLVFTPVWLVWLAGSDRAAIASARPIRRGHGVFASARRRMLLTVAALLPALACVGVAVASPAPLRLEMISTAATARGRVDLVRVEVTNTSARVVRPHFYLDPASHLRSPWRIASGPRLLRAHRRGVVSLVPALLGPETNTGALRVWALTDDPSTMSSVPLRRTG